jgi:hypothetical protein
MIKKWVERNEVDGGKEKKKHEVGSGADKYL